MAIGQSPRSFAKIPAICVLFTRQPINVMAGLDVRQPDALPIIHSGTFPIALLGPTFSLAAINLWNNNCLPAELT